MDLTERAKQALEQYNQLEVESKQERLESDRKHSEELVRRLLQKKLDVEDGSQILISYFENSTAIAIVDGLRFWASDKGPRSTLYFLNFCPKCGKEFSVGIGDLVKLGQVMVSECFGDHECVVDKSQPHVRVPQPTIGEELEKLIRTICHNEVRYQNDEDAW